MSRSNKARHGMKTKAWKGTMQTSRVDARARSSWKRIGARKERRTGVTSKVYHRKGKPQGVGKKGRTEEP
jgi:hypothetical protein